jgi:hypothetical protein
MAYLQLETRAFEYFTNSVTAKRAALRTLDARILRALIEATQILRTGSAQGASRRRRA